MGRNQELLERRYEDFIRYRAEIRTRNSPLILSERFHSFGKEQSGNENV